MYADVFSSESHISCEFQMRKTERVPASYRVAAVRYCDWHCLDRIVMRFTVIVQENMP